MAQVAKIDENSRPSLTAVSSVDGSVVPLYADPTTHRLLVDATGAGTGDVTGPASSTANHIPQFADGTGKVLKDGLAVVTTIGTPGTDTNIPTEKAVRDAIVVGGGTVTDVSVVTANGISGTVATSTTTPAITLALGNITPGSVTVTPLTDRQAGTFRRNSAGQTSHIIDVQTEVNAPLGNIDKDGNITMNNLSGTNTGDNATNNSALSLDQTSSQTIANGQPIQSSLTPSQIVATDGSKKLQTLSVATYPSLTELTYVKGVTSGIQTQFSSKKYYHGVVARPVGAGNPLPTFITTTTFTLGATANNISYYFQGTLVNVTADKTTTLSGAAGLYYVYFDAETGNILNGTGFPGISDTSNVILATVNWNGTDYGLVQDERHGYKRNCTWHIWAHNSIGTRYVSGITMTNNLGTGAAATFAVTSGEIDDEDIQFVVNAQTTGRLFWQTSASTYSFNKVLATTPGYLGVNNRPNVVNATTFAVTQLASANNRYANVFAYASNDLTGSIYFFTETMPAATITAGGYTSTALARAVPFPNVALAGLNPELKPIYRVIWRADGVLQAIDTTLDDYRTVSSLPQGAGTVSTTASAVTYNPTGNVTSGNVQDAISELDTIKMQYVTPSTSGNVLTSNGSIWTSAPPTGGGGMGGVPYAWFIS